MDQSNARTVTAKANNAGILDVKSLVLLAILLAAGFILNMTLGNALAIVGSSRSSSSRPTPWPSS